MAHIEFWEKPGCSGNARQRAWLLAAGHTLSVHDLLTWPWTRETLLAFLAPLPVAEWFNRAAPKVKSGGIRPEALDSDTALALLLAEPLLIRRPLMQVDAVRQIGFDPLAIDAWIGLRPTEASQSSAVAEACAMTHADMPCASPQRRQVKLGRS